MVHLSKIYDQLLADEISKATTICKERTDALNKKLNKEILSDREILSDLRYQEQIEEINADYKKLRFDVALQFANAKIASGKFDIYESKAEFVNAYKLADEFIVAGDK